MRNNRTTPHFSRRGLLAACGSALLHAGCNCDEYKQRAGDLRSRINSPVNNEGKVPKEVRGLVANLKKEITHLETEYDDCLEQMRIANDVGPLLSSLSAFAFQSNALELSPLTDVILPVAGVPGPALDDPQDGGSLDYILDAWQSDDIVVFDNRVNRAVGKIILTATSSSPLGEAQDMAITPGGRTLLVVAANTQPHVAVIDAERRAVSYRLMLPTNRFPLRVAVSADGAFAYLLVVEGQSRFNYSAAYVDVVELGAAPKVIGNIRLPDGLRNFRSFTATPDGALVVLHAQDSLFNRLHLVDLRSGTHALSFFRTSNAESSILSPDGAKIFIGEIGVLQQDGSRRSFIAVVDTASATHLADIPISPCSDTKLAITPLCESLMVGGPFNNSLQVINTQLNRVTEEIPIPLGLNQLWIA